MLQHMITAETRLFFREPGVWLLTILLPTIVLVAVGLVFGVEADPALGGLRWIDIFAPSMVVMTLAILGVNLLPARLVKYREKGVLRRLSTTPAQPPVPADRPARRQHGRGRRRASSCSSSSATSCSSIPMPKDPIGFAVAFLLGMSALFALGLLVAAVAPSAGIASALFVPLFALVMLLGGVYLPRTMLPELLIRIGDYTPPGVQALLDAWQGTSPQLAQLAAMALITVVAGTVAARRFRWE